MTTIRITLLAGALLLSGALPAVAVAKVTTATATVAPGEEPLTPDPHEPAAEVEAPAISAEPPPVVPPLEAVPVDPPRAETLEAEAAAEPSGVPGRWGFYFRMGGQVVADERIDALGAPTLARSELGLQFGVDPGNTGLALELGIARGSLGGDTFATWSSSLDVTSVQAAGLYRLPLLGPLGAYGRLVAALDVAHLGFTPRSGGLAVDALAFGASVGGTLGLELALPIGYAPTPREGARAADQWLVFFAEGGYALHTQLAFDRLRLDVQGGVTPARIDLGVVDVGRLDLSGGAFRLGLALRL